MKAGRKLALNVSIRQVGVAFFVLAVLLLVTSVFGAPKAEAAQSVPYKINFQGRLTNSAGNTMADGSYNMRFRLYSVNTGGTAVWTETRETTTRVVVANGLFSVQLGDVTPLTPAVFTSYPLYFEIELPTTATATCNTASCASFNGTEIMSPRRAVGATPYAMNADTLDGIDSDGFVRFGASQTGNIDIGTGTIASGAINGQAIGNAANFTGTLTVQGASALTLGTSGSNNASILFRSSGGSNTVTLTAPTTNPGSSYVLRLPANAPSLNQCLQNDGTTIGQLTFANCADNISVNGTAANDANFINTTSSGTTTGVTFSIGAGTPNTVATVISNASETAAGSVTTGAQTFAGDKIFKSTANSATAFRLQDSGNADLFTANASAKTVQIGSSTTDAVAVELVLDSFNGAADPTGQNGAMYYNTSMSKFRCYEGGVWKDCITKELATRSFVDSTVDAVADNNTTSYWDVAAENNSTTPNIVLSSTSKSVWGLVTVETLSTGTADTEVTARVERSIGTVATCGSGTAVGGQPGTFASNTNARKTSTTQFIDTPNTSNKVYYTVCSDVDTSGTTATVTRIRVTLFELDNSNL